MPFQPGESGNPNGRPRGIADRRTALSIEFFNQNAETLLQKGLELAERGYPTILRLLLDRILPRPRHSPVPFEMLQVKSPAGGIEAINGVAHAVSHGELSPAEAAVMVGMVRAASLGAVETDLAERVRKLEENAAEIEKLK